MIISEKQIMLLMECTRELINRMKIRKESRLGIEQVQQLLDVICLQQSEELKVIE